MLFVVTGSTSGSHCFSSMLDFDVICRGQSNFWKSLLALMRDFDDAFIIIVAMIVDRQLQVNFSIINQL